MGIESRSAFHLKGWLSARIKRAGEEDWLDVWVKPIENLITSAGLAQAALLLGDDTADAFDYGAIGEGTTPATVGDTALESEVDRLSASFSRETTTYSNDTGKWVTTHTAPGGGWSVTEYSLVTASSGGVIYNRVVFTAITVAATDQLEFTYKSQVTAV